MTEPSQHEEFLREVASQARRRRESRGQGVWYGLAQVGTVGWMIALPAVAGALMGRWIDEQLATGAFWTLSLLMIGLSFGCVAAWRAMNRELHG